MRPRHLTLAAATLLAAAPLPSLCLGQAAGRAAVRTPAPAARPKLIVFIAVDQLRPDYLDRWSGQLSGGLARLSRRGAVFTRGYQDHAITETAPGHASMLSGRFPRSTGTVRNTLGVNNTHTPR